MAEHGSYSVKTLNIFLSSVPRDVDFRCVHWLTSPEGHLFTIDTFSVQEFGISHNENDDSLNGIVNSSYGRILLVEK
jgi:hypothetical protein